MVELIVLINLTRANANHAIARGRSPGTAKLYTVLLWFVFAGLGIFLSAALFFTMGWNWNIIYIYTLVAIPMGCLGGFVSNRIAKRGEPFYTPPQ